MGKDMMVQKGLVNKQSGLEKFDIYAVTIIYD